MTKKIIVTSLIVSSLLLGVSVFADTQTATTPPPANSGTTASQTVLTCVSNAVNARETALGTAITAHSTAINSAYSARATALAQAYTAGTNAQIKAAIKKAWSDFNTVKRAATKAWNTARNSAWATFRTAAKACKNPVSISDSLYSGLEAAGQ